MLELQNVTVIFNEGTTLEKKALDNVSLTINDGDFVTILGSNGAGKSTFFNVITWFHSCKVWQNLFRWTRNYPSTGTCSL